MYTFSTTRATTQLGVVWRSEAPSVEYRGHALCCKIVLELCVFGNGEHLMSSTIETLERELGEAQTEREAEQRAVIRAENAHEAACSARDEAWSEGSAADPEVKELTDLVYRRRRELYDAIDRLKGGAGVGRGGWGGRFARGRGGGAGELRLRGGWCGGRVGGGRGEGGGVVGGC